MNKAFVRETDGDGDEDDLPPEPAGPDAPKNYITPAGHARIRAANGDRSENGDYIYGKRRLREIDRRIRFLTRRLDAAVVVDPAQQQNRDQAFFGATVTYLRNGVTEETVTIVGIDEVDPLAGRISWIAPVAKALLKAREGDVVSLRTPAGVDELEVLEIRYPDPD